MTLYVELWGLKSIVNLIIIVTIIGIALYNVFKLKGGFTYIILPNPRKCSMLNEVKIGIPFYRLGNFGSKRFMFSSKIT